MKTSVSKTALLAISMLLASLFLASKGFGQTQVTQIVNWTNAVHTTSQTVQKVTFTIPAGTGNSRLLVVALAASRSTTGSMTASIIYGGQTLTSIGGDLSTTTSLQHTQLYYLNNTGIQNATSDTLYVTVTGGTTLSTDAWVAVFDNVNQAAPIGTPQNFNSSAATAGPFSFAPSLTVGANNQAIEVVSCVRTASTTTRTINYASGWTNLNEQTATNFTTNTAVRNGIANRSSIPTTATTDASSTSFSGTALPSMTAVSLQPNSITTGTITGSPFCSSPTGGSTVSVSFTSTGTYTAGNTYTAQLSNSAGSFASPTNIGSINSISNSGTISATIPANTATGTGYRIRVISSTPAVTGADNGANLTINLSTASIAPTAAQNIGVNANGTTLNVTEPVAATSRQWFVSTTSGGPYNIPTGVTATSYTPMFTVQGTYYVVCVSTFSCGTVTSNQVQITVSPTITTSAISGSPFCVTPLAGSPVTVNFLSAGSFTGNTYTAQLSDAAGSFASPITLGTLPSNASGNLSISGTIPANTPGGSGYRIRVISSSPASVVTDNLANLTINLNTVSIAPTLTQAIGIGQTGTPLNVTETTTPVSRQWYYSTVSGGPYTQLISGANATSFTPNFATQGSYFVVCRTTYACGDAISNEVRVDVVPVITTGTISGSPFCVTSNSGTTVEVPYSSNGTFSGNTFTVQLSNALGSFAGATTIATLTSDASSGSITATIPAGTTASTGYRIRVISSSPAGVYIDNGSNLTVNLSSNSVAPSATQNINVGQAGNTLTVTETPSAAISREWFYGTSVGGPFTTATGETSTSFTPNFAAQGTYYVVCVSTFSCGTATSTPVQINVAATISTGAITGAPFCAGASFDLPFTSAGVFSGNTYSVQLSNAAGSFASPTVIGTLVSDANSGLINVTIPANTAAGTGYQVRVVSSAPVVTGSATAAFTINRTPVAAFTANTTSGTTAVTINFTDQSTNLPSSWSWTFAGGSPNTSSAQNPSVVYNTTGNFAVSLTATNGCGSNTATINNYITITALGNPLTLNSTGTFLAPPGVTCVKAEAWGGGGAGGGATRSFGTVVGGGGAGGSYAAGFVTVVPGTSYTVTVAATKTGTATGTNNGDPSWFGSTSTVFAQGGAGGGAANNNTGSAGVGSAAASIGSVVTAGSSGAAGNAGGAGGAGANGGGAGGTAQTGSGNGNPGTVAGGGGSGARLTTGSTASGGNGAAGKVVITWVDASNFSMTAPACTDGVTAVTVNSTSLINGAYTVTYNTTNPTNTGQTATMNFSGGTGTFNTIALTGPVSDVTVTAITFTGWTCSTPITSNNTVSVRLKPTATISYSGAPFCVTDASLRAVTVTTAASLTGGSYSATPAGLSLNATTGEIDPSLSTPATYTVRYDFTDGFCSNFATTSVVIGNPPVASFGYAQPNYCQYLPSSPNALSNPSPTFTGGGVAGTFSATPAGLNFVSTATGQINLATSAPGVYTVTNTVTANGCTTTASTTVTINALPTATISYSAPAFCLYSGIQNVTVNPSTFVFGSYSATPAGLTINTNSDFSDANAGQINPATSTPGTYTVKYTFTDGGCSNTATTTVVISTPVNTAVAAAAASVCTGSGTNITVASSSTTTSYQLRNNADNTLIGSPVTGTGGTINLPTGPLTAATTFNVLATVISSNCTLQMTATPTVTVVAQPTATAGGSQTICANGAATVSGATATNGTILWSHNGAGTLSNANTLTPTYTAAAADGGQTVTLTLLVSASPCTAATATYTIQVTALPVVSLSSSSVCIGSNTTLLSPTTGGTWVSSNPAVATVTNSGVVHALSGGTATFTFTDANTLCSNTTSALTVDPNCQIVTLSEPTQLSAVISGTATICEGQTTTISVTFTGGTAPYKVIYNSNEYTSGTSTVTFPVTLSSGLVLNSSNVTATDSHNCTSNTSGSATITVTPASAIVLQSGPSSQSICSGQPIATITYALGGTSTGASLSAGAFPAGLDASMNGNNFVISGTPTETGVFNFTITTSGPCPRSVSGSITVLATPIVNFSGLSASYCVNASAATLTGNHSSGSFSGPGVTDNGNGTASFNPATAGVGSHSITYSFTDVNGCSATQTQTVTVNPLPVVTCPGDLILCLSNGPLALSGGQPDGGIFSGTGVTNNLFDPTVAGVGIHTITYTYTDPNGCSNSCTFTISVVELVPVLDATPITHCGAYQPAALTVSASGGWPLSVENPYFYQWELYDNQLQAFMPIQDANGTNYQPPVLTPGTYTYRVTVYDLCGQYFTATKTITVYALPVASISYSNNPYCADGIATVTQTGQTGGTYSSTAGLVIDQNTGTINLGASTPGTYTVTYSFADDHCSNTTTTSVTVNPFPTATISYDNSPYCGLGTALVTLVGQTGGTFSAPAGLAIDQNTGAINLTNSTPGTYTVTYDFHNDFCSNSTSTSVTIRAVPTASISYGSSAYCATGSATVNQSGQANGTYSSTPGLVIDQNTGTINLAASTPGTYTVTYTFSNQFCTNTTTASITINPFPAATISYATPFCGRGTGAVTINGQGGGSFSSTVGLQINPTTGAIDLGSSVPGTYVVQYDFSNGFCSNSTTTSVTIYALPVINGTTKLSHNGSDLTCATSTDGQITVDAAGLAQPLQYSKDNGVTYQSSNVFSGLGQGTYHLVVKDANGCVSDEAVVTLVAPEVLNVAQSSVTNVSCFGGSNGEINLGLVTGGTPPYHYTWTKVGDANFFVEGTTPNLPGLAAGTYHYNVTDANNCANVEGNVTITQPIVSSSHTDVDCYGNSTGTATVTVTGAPGPFTFEWRNAGLQLLATNTNNTGTDVMNNLPAGTYHVTVIYSPSCSNVVDITIVQPNLLQATISASTNINCVSATSGDATVVVSGGSAPFTFLWDDANHQTSATATGLTAGTYHVTVTDSHNCTATTSVTITQNPPPAISNCPAAPLARNTNTGVCSYTISGTEMDVAATSVCPITYTYTLTGATNISNISGSLNGVVLQKGTTHVTCVVADALQSSTCSFDVVVSDHEQPAIVCPASLTINCQDSQDPDVNLLLGKATATDNCSLPANILITYTDVSTQASSPLVTGHYNYTITRTWKATDEAGNFTTCDQVITVHDVSAPTNIVIPADVNVKCAGDVPAADDQAVTASDNCGPVTVTHEDVIVNQTCVNRFVVQRTYTVTDVAGNSDTKMQTITVFDDIKPVISSCTPTATFCYDVSGQYTIPVLQASDNCSSFSVSYSITGATTRSGTGNNASGAFSIGVSTISWTVSDLCGNTETCSTVVTVYPIPPTPSVTVVNNCSSSTLSTNAAGALLWSTGATTSSITVNTPGTYTVTSTINGCTSPAGSGIADPIFVPATPVVTVVNNCDGTSVLSTNAPGTLHWSTGATGPSITVFTGGTYSVTQSNSCYTSAPGFGVAAPTFGANAPVVSITQPSCSNPTGTIQIVSPTTAGLTFSIDGINYQSSPIFNNLAPNTYSVSVKTPAGCTSPTTPATLFTQPSTPAIPVVTVVNNCDGTSTLSTTATGNLLWSTGATGSSITVINGGSYSVTQTVNGCTSLPGTAVAAPNTTPIAPILSVTQPNCTTATGSILVMVPTGAGLSYSIDGNNYQASPLFSGLVPNSYNVTVRNAGGCTSTASLAVILPGPTVPSTPVVNVVNNCNGTSVLSTTATGSLLWSTGATSTSIVVSNAGSYSVTQTVNGCTSAPGFAVAAPGSTPTTPILSVVQPNCTTSTGTITVLVPTGSGYTYSINGVDYQSSPVFSGLTANAYSITVMSSSGCVSNGTSATINPAPVVPPTPVVTVVNNCDGTSILSTTATGSLLWSTGASGSFIVVITGGPFSVTQTVNGCTSLPGIGVAAPNATPAPPTVVVTQTTCATATGTLTVTAPSGAGWTYSIDGVNYQSSAIFAGLNPGNYNVTAKSPAGCVSSISAATINAQPVTPNAPTVGTITQPNCTVSTGSVVLTGLPAGNWTIFPGNISGNGSSVTINNLAPGTYNFSVSLIGGCTSASTSDVVINTPLSSPSAPVVGTITQPNCSTSTGNVVLGGLPAGNWTINPGNIAGNTPGVVVTDLTPGSYNFTVTNSSGCVSVASVNVTINPQPATPAAPVVGTITQPTCAVATGSVVLSGLPAGSWVIQPGNISGNSSSVTISNLAPGVHNFNVTNQAGCVSLASADVVINPQPVTPTAPVIGTITQPTCAVATGSVILSGLPAGNWTINPGNITGSGSTTTLSGLAAGSYNFSVTNASGCTSLASINVTINPAPASPTAPVVGTITQPTCAVATGSVVLSGLPAGNWTIFPGNIAGNSSSITINNLSAGTYNFSVTNAVGCTSPLTGDVVINAQPATPAAPVVGTITQPSCSVATGSVILSGLPAGNWTINPGNITGSGSTTTVSGLAAGSYNFSVTNASGCTSLASINVTINPAPATPTAPVVGTITQPTCAVATGSVILSGLPAGNWTIFPGNIAGNSSSITVNNLAPGTYNFSVTNAAGCTSPLTGNVVINVQPTPPTPPVVGTITQPTVAVPTGSVVLSGLPAGTWTINPGAVSGTGSSTTISNLAPGSYNFTVTNAAGCTSLFSANVVINSLVVPTAPLIGQITQPTCAVATGTVVLNGLPSTGSWTLTRNPGNVVTNGSGSSFLISGLAPGSYTYTVTNSGGTSDPSAAVVINPQPVAPNVAAITGTFTVCAGSATQLSDVTAGGVWSVAPGTGTATISGSGLVTGVTAGTVTVSYTVTTACGTAIATATVTINAIPAATISYATAAPANQLLALPMNEGTGTTTADISGRAHPGTLTNTPTWIAGRYGQALNFNGTSSYVNIADHADFTLTPTQNYTWSAWVRNTNFNQWSTVFSQTLDVNTFFYIYAHSSTDAEAGPVTNGVSVYWYNGTNKLVVHSNNNVLTANTWSHIAVTYNGAAAQANRFTIYVNGVNVTATGDIVSAGTLAAIDPTNIRVGSNQPFGEFLNGAVDEVRYYNRLLTAAEITTDMNTALAAPSNGTFCPTGTATVTQTGQANGSYSSTPGLSINGTTGAINLAASTPGNYVVTYSFSNGSCGGTATANVVIAGQPTSISYAGGPFCQSGTASVTINGQTGGSFSSTAGLSINATTGAINLAASTPGTYTVTYNYGSSGCTGSVTTSVTIVATPATSITYAGSPFCQNGSALVTITGTTGGTFSSTAGLSINPTTGAINLAASTTGTYTVTYTYSNGNCGGVATTTVTINTLPVASISYAGGPFCQNGTATVTQTGQTGGSYSAAPAGLSINATTGAINLAASTPGTYTVTYAFGNGSCASTTTTTVSVVTGPSATISYAGGPFCTSGSVSVTQAGQANGSYAATPAGLSINNTTGAINLAASAPGTYTVTYSFTNGVCGGTATTSVVVNSLPTATIAYTPPAPAGLLMALPMNEGTGTTTADISGRAHPGTLTSAPTWIAGRYGQGLSFNGTSSYLNIADHNDFTLTPTQNYTWSGWVRNNNFNQWSTIFSQTIDASNFFYFYAHSSTDVEAGPVTNGISVYWYNGANKIVLHSNNNVLTANNWAHIAVTYNGATGVTAANRFTIYVNGVDVTNRTDVVSAGTLGVLNPTNIRIGSNQPFGEFLNGSVDEFRYYNRLLTAAEITTDMNTALTPANGSFCQSLGTASVTQAGQAGGTYSAPAGVSINATTGAINLAASTPGTYTITYTFGSGSCTNSTSTSITIVNCTVVARVVNNPANPNNLAIVPGNLSMTVFPNPTLTYFNLRVKSKRPETVEVKVYDMLGRLVQQDRGAPQQTFRLGDRLAAGVYVVEALQAGEKVTQKVIKKADGEINYVR